MIRFKIRLKLVVLLILLTSSACGETAEEPRNGEPVVETPAPEGSDQDGARDESDAMDGETSATSPDDTPQPDEPTDPTEPPPEEEEPPPATDGGCGSAVSTGESTITLTHDGMERSFRVYVPSSYDPQVPSPVVLNFHGRSMTASQQALLSQMDPVAESEGFLAVYPEGTGSFEQTFNGGWCCGSAQTNGVDDVGFTAAVLDELEARMCVDTDRVFAIGMSNGGFMAHRLGCDLADRITAIGGVAGTLGVFNCSPARPVPVIHFHGTSDSVVPYDGFVGQVSVESTVDEWRSNNGCSGGSDVYYSQGDVSCEEWTNCDAGSEVRLCTVEGGGHTWPGGTSGFLGGLGKTTDNVSATEHAWEFFRRFTL